MKVIVLAEETSWKQVNPGPGLILLGVYTLNGFKNYLDNVINEDLSQMMNTTFTFFICEINENLNSIHDLETIWQENRIKGRISYWINRDGKLTWHLHESPGDYEEITYENVLDIFNNLLDEENSKIKELNDKIYDYIQYIQYLKNHIKYMPGGSGALEAKEHFYGRSSVNKQDHLHTETPKIINPAPIVPISNIIVLTSEYRNAGGIEVSIYGTYTLNGLMKYLDNFMNEVANNKNWNYYNKYTIYIPKVAKDLREPYKIGYNQIRKISIDYAKNSEGRFVWYLCESGNKKEISYDDLIKIFKDLSVDEDELMTQLEAKSSTYEPYIEYLENHIKYMPDGEGTLAAHEHFYQSLINKMI